MTNQDFVKRLQQEAAKQALLQKHRVLPAGLDTLTALVGNYPWQSLVVAAVISALVLEFLLKVKV